jgi:hypothetical protein
MHDLVKLDQHNHLEVLEVKTHQELKLLKSLGTWRMNSQPHIQDVKHLPKVHNLNRRSLFGFCQRDILCRNDCLKYFSDMRWHTLLLFLFFR